jgi:hypothetical protein
LPACTRCNRLRWHRKGEGIRELLFLGLIARDEIRSGGAVGRSLVRLREQRIHRNEMRRKSRDRASTSQGIALSESASLDARRD